MPVTTRAGKKYDLTAPTVTERRRRRRAGMSVDEIAVVQREHAAGMRAARARMTDDRRAAENTERRATRAMRTDVSRAAERRRHTAWTRATRAVRVVVKKT